MQLSNVVAVPPSLPDCCAAVTDANGGADFLAALLGTGLDIAQPLNGVDPGEPASEEGAGEDDDDGAQPQQSETAAQSVVPWLIATPVPAPPPPCEEKRCFGLPAPEADLAGKIEPSLPAAARTPERGPLMDRPSIEDTAYETLAAPSVRSGQTDQQRGSEDAASGGPPGERTLESPIAAAERTHSVETPRASRPQPIRESAGPRSRARDLAFELALAAPSPTRIEPDRVDSSTARPAGLASFRAGAPPARADILPLPHALPDIKKPPEPVQHNERNKPVDVKSIAADPAPQNEPNREGQDDRDRGERERTPQDRRSAPEHPGTIRNPLERSASTPQWVTARAEPFHPRTGPVEVQNEPAPAARANAIAGASETAKPAAIKEIAIQLPGAGDRGVDLHIVATSGKVHVEVRTDDARLASSLRDNVGELVQKLDSSGYPAQPRPETRDEPAMRLNGIMTATDKTEGGAQRMSAEREQPGGGSHPDQHQKQQQQQHGHPRGNRPRWLEEIRKNFMASRGPQEDNTNGSN